MLDNPIYNPTASPHQKSQVYKTAEYQTARGLKFVFKWIGIAIRSTIQLFRDMLHQALGR